MLSMLCSSVFASEKPTVLMILSSHISKPKSDILLPLSEKEPFELVNFSTKGKSDEEIDQAWSSADFVLLDGINPALSKFMFAKYQPKLAQFSDVKVASLGDIENLSMNQGLSDENRVRLGEYYNNAGRTNYANMMKFITNDILALEKIEDIPAPVIVPKVGLYHEEYNGDVTDDETAFYKWLNVDENKPVIAIGMHRSIVDFDQKQVVNAIIEGLEAKGAKAFGFFFEGEDLPMDYTTLLQDEAGNARVDLMINYRALHYVSKRRNEFEKLGVPVIHALNYTEGDEAAFEADVAGISPSLTPFFLVMPEDTGSADPTIIAATTEGVKVVMKDQMNALVERAFNHASLSKVANNEKKIATFIWNYPPGEKNIGAAFLDVPSSIEQIAIALKAEGYNVETKDAEYLIESAGQLLRPFYRNEDTSALIEKGLADYLPMSTYLDWFEKLPEQVKSPIVERWGKPEENSLVTEIKEGRFKGEQGFVIPRMDLGNLIVLPQGMRGKDAKEHSSLYHSTKTPINHAYLAFYLYARETFGANAFVHLGTHGSQEWLTGKERGLSVWDAPNLAIGNLPVFYPYIIDNVGEAMQAKRRGRATMVSHLTPGFAKAGLYAEVANLSELINNYMMLEDGQTKQNTQDNIVNLAEELNILKDLNLAKDTFIEDFDNKVSTIQDHLNELAQQSQPLGVHTFGLLPKEAHLFSTMIQVLGEEFANRAATFESENGLSVSVENQLDERNVEHIEALAGFQLLKAIIKDKREFANLSPELIADIETAKKYWDNFQNIAEIKNLMSALEGEYIPVSHGGDPIRNPDAAPTGRNLIGFNPAKVPSKEAYAAGVQLMDQTINDYYAKHGKYPKKLAFSLWSLETMRHQGALEAQILHAMGLKPKWNRQGNVVGTEVIEFKDLGRPRVDVVISATGLYRDAFPNVMIWLAEAIDKVAKMKEENNFVYRHANSLKQELIEQGKTEEDADYLSSLRIFSNETGNYGTGLAGASLASDTWEDDSKLSDLYLARMGFAYGKDESRWSENVADMGLYGKVLSGTDGVIFSRSTNLYALLTNDDPFQYFGGIGLAVRNLDGKTPEMYVANMRRKDNMKTQTMADFLNQEMRSRYFHPRWIKAMQDSGYAGATAILDRMNNMWGWEVMTPEAVRDDQWQEFFEVYVNDKYDMDMREFFEQHNAHSLAQIIERMLEAVRKGYWQADEETIKKMVETYTELATEFDVVTDNQKFTEYVDTQVQGFGLAPLPAPIDAPAVTAPSAPATQQVTGQKLEEQKTEVEETDSDYTWLYIFLLIFGAGFVSYYVERAPRPEKAATVAFKKAA